MKPNRLAVIRLSAATPCDPRTASAFLAGRFVRSDILRHRLETAAAAIGLAPASQAESKAVKS